MKTIIDYIYESSKTDEKSDFKKDLELNVSSLKFKDGVGSLKFSAKKYNEFISNYKYMQYPYMYYLGGFTDESGLYSLDGGETISGDSAEYSDYKIEVDSGNIYIFRSLKLNNKEVYVTIKKIDNVDNEPILKVKDIINKLKKLLPYDMSGETVLKKYFKTDNVSESTAKFPGPDKDILVEIKKGSSLFELYVNGEKKFSNNPVGIEIKLSGSSLRKYLEEYVYSWYKEQIK